MPVVMRLWAEKTNQGKFVLFDIFCVMMMTMIIILVMIIIIVILVMFFFYLNFIYRSNLIETQ